MSHVTVKSLVKCHDIVIEFSTWLNWMQFKGPIFFVNRLLMLSHSSYKCVIKRKSVVSVIVELTCELRVRWEFYCLYFQLVAEGVNVLESVSKLIFFIGKCSDIGTSGLNWCRSKPRANTIQVCIFTQFSAKYFYVLVLVNKLGEIKSWMLSRHLFPKELWDPTWGCQRFWQVSGWVHWLRL